MGWELEETTATQIDTGREDEGQRSKNVIQPLAQIFVI
jgi:hypothetical protein